MSEMPVINTAICSGCGLCVSVCLCGALVIADNVAAFLDTVEECGWCTECELVCPTGAITCPFEIIFE